MTSESQAHENDHRPAAAHRQDSRLLHDIKADWRRWTGIERATATMAAVLLAFVPLYLAFTFGQMH